MGSPTQQRDLDAALAAARRHIPAPPMPRGPLRLRLKTSPRLRRALPTSIAVGRAEAHGRSLWENDAEVRERALRIARAILGGSSLESEALAVARQHVIEDRAQKALFWQPWPTNHLDDSSRRHLERALAADRGILVSPCHLGPFFRQISAVSSYGRAVYTVSAPWFFEPPSPDLWGRRIARWWDGMVRREEHAFLSVGSFPVVSRLLEQREIVMIFFDMPGGTRTQFLGKPVMLASGTARLACQSDALILPLRARREGARVWTDVFEPLDPREHESFEDLHLALARVHERSILELPATLEDPNRAGAWEGGADEREWARPS